MAEGSSSTQQSMPETDDFENDLTQTSTQYSLSRALHARKDEFVRPHRIRIKVGSWNVAACPGTDKDLASWFVDGEGLEPRFDTHLADQRLKASGTLEDDTGEDENSSDEDKTYVDVSSKNDSDAKLRQKSEVESNNDEPKVRIVGGSDIGLYVLGLQEIISLNIIAGYADTTATEKWKAALEAAMPPFYKLVAAQQLSGLLLLIYASPDVSETISNVSTVSVGTGLLGYMGNKGGISTRLVLGETTRVVFTDCHLASGHDQTNLERRWWDYNKILSQTQFSPITHGGVFEVEGEKIGDEDFAFWFGDLNFRLDGLPGDDIRRLLMLHTRGEYDLAKKRVSESTSDEDGVIVMHNKDPDDGDGTETPGMISREASFDQGDDENAELPDPDDFVPDPHDDPASLQATLDSLLPHDQLARTIKDRKAFHEGWSEGPITFLPSYKYDVGTVGLFDSSEKRRAPSWCDRILYRTKNDLDKYKTKIKEEEDSKKKDEDMKKRGIDTAADDESVLFDYDPDQDTSSSSANDGAYDYDEYDDDEDAEGEGQTVVTKEGYEDHIRLDLYTTHQRITSSDHKPIVALFTLDYDAVVPELKAKVHAEVARELDRAENEGRPGITIVVDTKEGGHHEDEGDDGSGGVDFGDIEFMKPVTRTLTVANTGGVHATIGFVGKPGIDEDEPVQADRTSKPEWLSVTLRRSSDSTTEEPDSKSNIETEEITLEPGETASAALTVCVTSLSHLQSLNSGTTSLEDVLVLRVTDGRDHFIPIRANSAPSCFGRSIEELIRVTPHEGGLRGFVYKLRRDKDNLKEWKGGSIPYNLNPHSSSPPELYKLTAAVEALAERVVADESMVQDEEAKVPRDRAGWPFADTSPSMETEFGDHVYSLIRALDTDDPTNFLDALPKTEVSNLAKLEIVAAIMLLFLRSLVDGVIPAPLFAKIETALPALGSSSSSTRPAREVEDDKSTILDILSGAPYHNISFVFVTSMLAKLAADITPLNTKELELLNSDSKSKGKARKLSFRKSILGGLGSGVDQAAIQRRLDWESKAAEIFGPALCRTGNTGGDKGKEKEKKASEERMKALVEVFMRRREVV